MSHKPRPLPVPHLKTAINSRPRNLYCLSNRNRLKTLNLASRTGELLAKRLEVARRTRNRSSPPNQLIPIKLPWESQGIFGGIPSERESIQLLAARKGDLVRGGEGEVELAGFASRGGAELVGCDTGDFDTGKSALDVEVGDAVVDGTRVDVMNGVVECGDVGGVLRGGDGGGGECESGANEGKDGEELHVDGVEDEGMGSIGISI